jgi:NADH:ubiquinone oxidoreductase subunit 4 (subunit M)
MLFLLLLFLLLGFIIICCINIKYVRVVSFNITLGIFLFSIILLFYYNNMTPYFQFQFFITWSEYFNIFFSIGLDGISLFFIILTTFLIPICFLLSWLNITYRLREYVICMLITEFFLINVFSVLDLFFFYLFFESILIPMFLIIGVWGSRQRKIHAGYQFFFYTLIGSLLMLISIIYIYLIVGTTDLNLILLFNFNKYTQIILWLCFFFFFSYKNPNDTFSYLVT